MDHKAVEMKVVENIDHNPIENCIVDYFVTKNYFAFLYNKLYKN